MLLLLISLDLFSGLPSQRVNFGLRAVEADLKQVALMRRIALQGLVPLEWPTTGPRLSTES